MQSKAFSGSSNLALGRDRETYQAPIRKRDIPKVNSITCNYPNLKHQNAKASMRQQPMTASHPFHDFPESSFKPTILLSTTLSSVLSLSMAK